MYNSCKAKWNSHAVRWCTSHTAFEVSIERVFGVTVYWVVKILSDPRLIPYHSPDSILTILWDSNTMLTIPPNSNQPPRPLTHHHCSLRPPNNLWNPQPHFCLHYSVLVSLHSNLIFTSLSQFSSFHFWYIAPFQHSCSLILASALPSYISASLPLNSWDPL